VQVINNMNQTVQDYCRDVPQNTGRQMIYAFGVGTILRTILRNNLRLGLIAGVLSAIATAIHGWVTPLFQRIIAHRHQLTWGEEMCRTCVGIITTAYIAAACGDISLLNQLYIDGLIHGLCHFIDDSRRDVRDTNIILLFPSLKSTL